MNQPSLSITKVLTGFSTAHRAWWAESHCRHVHGYDRTFKITLGCSQLERGWVYNFGGFKEIKRLLEDQFDHTTCIAEDDPHLALFQQMHEMDLVDLRVMPNPGMEGAASWVAELVGRIVSEETSGRVFVERVEAWENEKNAAVWSR